MGKNQNTGKIKPGDTCSLCDRPLKYLTPIPICRMHYQRWWQYGSFDWVRKHHKPYPTASGYLWIWDKERKSHVQHHRWVMEQHLGRRLEPHEHVHHIDGNKQNNDISNLLLTDVVRHNHLHSGNVFVEDWNDYMNKIPAARVGSRKVVWTNDLCIVHRCENRAKTRALCQSHYLAFLKWTKRH